MNHSLFMAAAADENLFPEPTAAQTSGNILIFLLAPALLIFQFCMLIHCLVKPVKNKLAWVLALVFLPFIGGLLYFFLGRKHQKPATGEPSV